MLTLSIALLVRPSLDPLLALLALGIDAFLRNAVLDTAEAGAGVIALLARLLTVGAGVLDLTALGASGLGGDHAGREGVHVHGGHAGVGDGMHGHLGLDGVCGRLGVMLRVGLGIGVAHGEGRVGRTGGRKEDKGGLI